MTTSTPAPPDAATGEATHEATRYDALLSRFDAQSVPPLVIAVGLEPSFLAALERRSGTARVLAIEPIAARAAQTLDHPLARAWLAAGRLTVLIGPEYQGRTDAWKLLGRRAPSPPMIVAPELEAQFSAQTAAAKTVAEQIVLGALANEEARKRFAGRYLLNTLSNLSRIATEGDASALDHLFADIPAVVVGAGPSLDRNLAALQKMQDRVLLIAVDTALRPLLAAGITPHLVVSVDPSETNARHLLDLPDTRGLWLLAEASLDPKVFPAFTGRTFFFKVSNHEPWPWLAEQGVDRGTLQAWGSVLTTAFDVALRAGCDPIVFAGSDLAFTKGLQYCRNTTYEPQWSHFGTDAERAAVFATYLEDRPSVSQPDVSGRQVVTLPHFVQFRDWLVAQATSATSRRVVNATGGGILHGGRIENRSLESLLLPEHRGDDLGEAIAATWAASVTQSTDATDRLERALQYGVAIPFQPWIEFGGDTAPPAQIVDTTRTSSAHLTWTRRKLAYLARHRASYDRRIQTPEDARDLSHGHYEIAARKADAQQAHILLDYLRRTYRPGKPGLQQILRAVSTLPTDLQALDVGCGVGRSMEAMLRAGVRVDGVDISERMLHFARQNPALERCELFLSRGDDCGRAPDGVYDLVYSQLCFRYICSRSVRNDLIRAMARAVRPEGMVVVELRFFPHETAASIPAPHVPWSADSFESTVEAGEADVRLTPDELPLIYEDFSRYLEDVRLQFGEVPRASRTRLPPQLWISGSPRGDLASRINAMPRALVEVRR